MTIIPSYNPKLTGQTIKVVVLLSHQQCEIGTVVSYTITFSEPITIVSVVPISISDRNGDHVTNIGCTIVDGEASGTFMMDRAGDFTVTNEDINFHKSTITTELELTNQPWLRVYQ